jgi:hypothetical protein
MQIDRELQERYGYPEITETVITNKITGRGRGDPAAVAPHRTIANDITK